MALKVRFLTETEIESACLELLRKFAKADDFKLAPPIPIEGRKPRHDSTPWLPLSKSHPHSRRQRHESEEILQEIRQRSEPHPTPAAPPI